MGHPQKQNETSGYRFHDSKAVRKITRRRPLLYPVRISGSPSGSVGRRELARSLALSLHPLCAALKSRPGELFHRFSRRALSRSLAFFFLLLLRLLLVTRNPIPFIAPQLVRKLVPIVQAAIKVSPLSTTISIFTGRPILPRREKALNRLSAGASLSSRSNDQLALSAAVSHFTPPPINLELGSPSRRSGGAPSRTTIVISLLLAVQRRRQVNTLSEDIASDIEVLLSFICIPLSPLFSFPHPVRELSLLSYIYLPYFSRARSSLYILSVSMYLYRRKRERERERERKKELQEVSV